MTREDAELVLKDLCSRLPYGVIALTEKGKGHICDINLTIFGAKIGININSTVRDTFSIDDVKPYLFPLSTISNRTLEMLDEWSDSKTSHVTMEFFNSHHIDYRGLIEKGLAIDATGLNIY